MDAFKTIDGKMLDGIKMDSVTYRKIKDVKRNEIEIPKIPFTKRWPYRCEEEFRIIFESNAEPEAFNGFFEVDISLKAIRKITISQNISEQEFQKIKEDLKIEFNNPSQRIYKSTLYANKIWISKFKST